jgi:geranylgeranyl pyrophosphate synthase
VAQSNGQTILTLHKSVDATAVADPVEMDDPISRMMAKLRTSGAIEAARLQALETIDRARAALDGVPPSPARDELLALTDDVLNRNH